MAKKKNELSYMQLPLPQGGRYSKMTKLSFSGLNKRRTLDTGALSMERNISTLEAPYLTPSHKRISLLSGYTSPISMFGFDDFLLVVYRQSTQIKIDYITINASGGTVKYTGNLAVTAAISNDGIDTFNSELTDEEREDYAGQYYYDAKKELYYYCNGEKWIECSPASSIVQFNVYDMPSSALEGKYIKKLLIFPDKKSMGFKITENFTPSDMSVNVREFVNSTNPIKDDAGTIISYPPPETASHNYWWLNTYHFEDPTYNNLIYHWVDDPSDSSKSGWKVAVPPTIPDIKYAAVHLSRIFGVDDERVYASGYNDYSNWNFDSIYEYNESNAWCSPAQSNTKAGGVFTGITTFQTHVVCFKHDFMHEIYNTKNPFRLQDIYAEGAIDHRTIQDVDGKLIFVSADDVKIYTGSNPRIIGYNLNMSEYAYAVSGTDGRSYYLYCEDAGENRYLFVYDAYIGEWSEQSISDRVLSFAHNKNGMYMLTDDGMVYKMDSNNYNHAWSFETDLITNKTVDIKHIKKLQMLADIASDADMQVYILYDDETYNGHSHLVYSSDSSGKVAVRVKPRQTANYGFKLHIEGYGYVKLYELEIFMQTGGDLYVSN